MAQADPEITVSTGHMLADIGRLQLHYRAKQAEYEATLRSVGVRKGWKVLDAGCGIGSFLPLMAELVGKDGFIAAIDLAPENIEYVEYLIAKRGFACPIEPRIGNVLSLPYSDNTFDSVWSANVIQYLTEEELRLFLSEAYRVIRPGGLVAIKEVDVSIMQYHPLDPLLVQHLFEAGRRKFTQVEGYFQAIKLPALVRETGFVHIRPKTTLYERWNPLRPVEKEFIGNNLAYLASLSEKVAIAEEEREKWREIGRAPQNLMEHPDFYFRTMHVLVTGQKMQT